MFSSASSPPSGLSAAQVLHSSALKGWRCRCWENQGPAIPAQGWLCHCTFEGVWQGWALHLAPIQVAAHPSWCFTWSMDWAAGHGKGNWLLHLPPGLGSPGSSGNLTKVIKPVPWKVHVCRRDFIHFQGVIDSVKLTHEWLGVWLCFPSQPHLWATVTSLWPAWITAGILNAFHAFTFLYMFFTLPTTYFSSLSL